MCCDTSFPRALYGTDAHTPAAESELSRLQTPLLVTDLNLFEFSNSLRFSECRRFLQPGQTAAFLAAIRSDMQAGKVTRAVWCDLKFVLIEAEKLSSRYTMTGGHRTFDALHVAAAIHLQAHLFFTFDANQRRLAIAAKLTVRP